ncbi:MAG: nucleotidyltransferase domain-containing protein [archaeon]
MTQKWVRLLFPFTNNYGARLTETELSRLSDIPQQTASRYLNQLVEQNLIDYTRQGKNKLFYIDHSRQTSILLLEILEAHKALHFQQKSGEISLIINDILKTFESVIVFGSYSSYTFDKDSDLDLVIIGKDNQDLLKQIKQRHTININEHILSANEFSRSLRSKNPLSLEILKNHIIFGNISRIVSLFSEVSG